MQGQVLTVQQGCCVDRQCVVYRRKQKQVISEVGVLLGILCNDRSVSVDESKRRMAHRQDQVLLGLLPCYTGAFNSSGKALHLNVIEGECHHWQRVRRQPRLQRSSKSDTVTFR